LRGGHGDLVACPEVQTRAKALKIVFKGIELEAHAVDVVLQVRGSLDEFARPGG